MILIERRKKGKSQGMSNYRQEILPADDPDSLSVFPNCGSHERHRNGSHGGRWETGDVCSWMTREGTTRDDRDVHRFSDIC